MKFELVIASMCSVDIEAPSDQVSLVVKPPRKNGAQTGRNLAVS